MEIVTARHLNVGADGEIGFVPRTHRTVSVRQIDEPTKRLPGGPAGSSS
jgi:hypothetical protein